MTQRLQQKIFGGLAFLTALITYLLTLEPTASFWDCSEFIACAYKLEVGHAPGAPVYMLLGRLFSLFAAGNTENVAMAINALSAVASALTILLLFHIIYWFVGKLMQNTNADNSIQSSHFVALVASLVGSLSYAFTDSFWFSAVEAEVYATSSFFSALVFWCITRYDQEKEGWPENRWLILIFFLLGLSVGVHLLNMLALPAMSLVIYFKHFRHTLRNMIITLCLSVLMIVVFVYGIIPGVVKSAAWFDLLFVNTLKLPVYSGVIAFILLLVSAILMLITYFGKTKRFVLRFVLVLFSFWLVGYSSFAILVIRSADNPFVDINNVENVFGLVDYLNREQYGQRPLIFGNNYNSPITDSKKRNTYKLYNKTYFQDELNPEYSFDEQTLTLFPRMASMEARHVDAYNRWVDIKGRKVKITGTDGSQKTLRVPTFADNLRFFIKYQLGHMYFRYFMWNFSGRQNDIQGYGGKYSGNWISGLPILDNWHLGDQSHLPDSYKNHKAKNSYFLLPLLIGILGIIFHLKHDKQNFIVALTLFMFTGPAIVIYLNEVPITPRERDYVHVGSFLVFTLWIGLGAASILQTTAELMKRPLTKWVVSVLLIFLVPGILFIENWDDHNRSGRYAARDFGKNMLNSCAENAILFTTADNDTYPIWYLQQVEGYRTDVRQVLTTFLPIDWYGNQMNYKYEGCGSVPISFNDAELLLKTNQYFPVMTHIDSSIDVKEMVGFIKNNNKRTQVQTSDGEIFNYIPGKNLSLAVNADNFVAQNEDLQINRNDLPATIDFTINKNFLTRDELLILDILANNNWSRPVYTIYPSMFDDIGLAEYVHREGMLFRLLPYKNTNLLHDRKAFANHQYNLITEQFTWGKVNDPNVFIDHTIIHMAGAFRFRQMFVEVANELISVGENSKAENLVDLALHIFPESRFPHGYYSAKLAQCYYSLGQKTKGDILVESIHKSSSQNLRFYLQGEPLNADNMSTETQLQVILIQEIIRISGKYNKSLNVRFIESTEQFF